MSYNTALVLIVGMYFLLIAVGMLADAVGC